MIQIERLEEYSPLFLLVILTLFLCLDYFDRD